MSAIAERFADKVASQANGCWLWIGTLTQQGYGQFHLDGITHFAHRVSYRMHVADVPDGLVLDHLCRNRACVNPDHLEPVTQRVNVLRGESFCADEARRTHCPQGHEYTPENTRIEKGSKRHCRTCTREWASAKVACPECGALVSRRHIARHRREVHVEAVEKAVA